MRKYAAKVDRNQPEIVAALRAVGASVQPLHTVGDGVPDLLVGYRGTDFLLEVKDGLAQRSDQKLRATQVDWHKGWRGRPPAVVLSVADALAAIGAPVRGC